MTAIAGVVRAADRDCFPTCNAMLRELEIYGGRSSTIACDAATFGITASNDKAKPIYSATGQYLVVADIRLDNRNEVRRSLISDAKTDLELLAAAWERWGTGCLDRIAGDFAIAVLDRRDGEVTLVRDHTGQRPLFYCRAKEAIGFASMPSALLRPGETRRFNMDRLAAIPLGATADGHESYFANISKVRAGEWVALSRSGERRGFYWHPNREVSGLDKSQLVEAYHNQLRQAVECRIGYSCEATAVQLSSGFDSNSIAATAARFCRNGFPTAFTAAPNESFNGPVPRGRIGDESSLASLTAKLLGIKHVIVRPAGTMLANLKRHSALYQDPDRNVANMQWWSALLGRASDMGVRTMLTGQMGNLSIHAGGLPVLAEWIRRMQLGHWWREARLAAKGGTVRWRGILYNSFEPWIPQATQRLLWRRAEGNAGDDQTFLRKEWSIRAQSRNAIEASPLRTGDMFEDRLAIIRTQDTGMFRLGALAESGIEERDPTADRRLIEWSLNLPAEELFSEGVSRPLARRALEGHLPVELLENPLRGYQAADWFLRFEANEAHDLIDELAESHAANELLDLKRMRWAIDHWPKTDQASPAARLIFRRRWTLAMSIGVFLKQFERSA